VPAHDLALKILIGLRIRSWTGLSHFGHNDHSHHDGWGVRVIKEVSAVNFRQNLGEMLNLVQYRNESIVINKDGKPLAALVDAELFARIRRMRDRFDALSNRIAEAYGEVPPEEGLAEIDSLVAQNRAS
jgi:prevent-host-death family protein